MDLMTFLTIAGGLVTVGGAVVGWILALQKRIHAIELRVQRQEDTAVHAPKFEADMKALRAFIGECFDELESRLEPLQRAVDILSDREGIDGARYTRVNSRIKPRADG
jgi:hypothetical protein